VRHCYAEEDCDFYAKL